MFDVSWSDQTQETVGQRKTRKDQRSKGISRGSSVKSSGSSASQGSKGSKSSDSTGNSKVSLFGFFASNQKSALSRNDSQSRASALNPGTNAKTSRRISSYISSESSSPPTYKTLSIPENDDFTLRNMYKTDTAVSSPTDGRRCSLAIYHYANTNRLCFFRLD